MKVGFTGTRHGLTPEQHSRLFALLRTMQDGWDLDIFHHGGCRGADEEAAEIAETAFNYRGVYHPGPDGDSWRVPPRFGEEVREAKTHFARNRDIVNETDVLVACPAEMEEQPRGGTWWTIKFARKAGKPVVIVYPDGSVTETKPLEEVRSTRP